MPTDRLPFYIEFDTAGAAQQLTEFQPDDVVPQSSGGTGSTSLSGAVSAEITAQGLPTTQDLSDLQALIPTQASDIDAIPLSEKGVADGVCSLDTNQKVPLGFLPIKLFDVSAAISVHTNSNSVTSKLQITVPAGVIAAQYLVQVSYGFNSDSTTQDFMAWLEKDTVLQGQRHRVEPKDTAGSAVSGTGTDQANYTQRRWLLALTGGETFDYVFTTTSNGIRASMFDALMTIERYV